MEKMVPEWSKQNRKEKEAKQNRHFRQSWEYSLSLLLQRSLQGELCLKSLSWFKVGKLIFHNPTLTSHWLRPSWGVRLWEDHLPERVAPVPAGKSAAVAAV